MKPISEKQHDQLSSSLETDLTFIFKMIQDDVMLLTDKLQSGMTIDEYVAEINKLFEDITS